MFKKINYSLSRKQCAYCYISKQLKKEIDSIQKDLQRKENTNNGKKAKKVTFSYASKELSKRIKK